MAASFCKLTTGFGINKEHLHNRHTSSKRTFSALSIQQPSSRYCYDLKLKNKPITSLLRSNRRQSLIKSVAEPVQAQELGGNSSVTSVIEEEPEISRGTLIWRAIKLPMYTVAFTPVTVACAVAYWQTGLFSLSRYLMMLASYCIVIAWVNLSNDVYDFDTGADVNKKESVVNLFGGRTLINTVAWTLLAIGFAGLTSVAIAANNPRSLVLLIAATFGFFLYQCPPFRLSYYGVGEPLLFVSFGPLSTIAFYLLNSTTSELPITGTAIWSSIIVGLTTSLILFCSHFHQIKDDKAVGKMSPLVRLGTEMGSQVVKFSIIGLYAFLFGLGFTQTLPLASVILCTMTLPMGNLIVDFVRKNHTDNTKIFMSKYLCVRLHTIFGAALAAGLVISRLFAKQFPQAIML